jgi:hypothetical protein
MAEKSPIRFKCSSCGKVIKIAATHAGKKGNCSCGAILRIPERPYNNDVIHTAESSENTVAEELEDVSNEEVETVESDWLKRLPPPEVLSDKSQTYDEVLVDDKIVRYDSVEDLRGDLLTGKVSRFNLVRQIAPEPRLLGKTRQAKLLYLDTIKDWEYLRGWTQIGKTIALRIDGIKQLYYPSVVYEERAQEIVYQITLLLIRSLLCGFFLYIVIFRRDLEAFLMFGLYCIGCKLFLCFLSYMLFEGTINRPIVSYGIGVSLGRVVGRYVAWIKKKSFPRPPEDGFEYQCQEGLRELIYTDNLSQILLLVSVVLTFPAPVECVFILAYFDSYNINNRSSMLLIVGLFGVVATLLFWIGFAIRGDILSKRYWQK